MGSDGQRLFLVLIDVPQIVAHLVDQPTGAEIVAFQLVQGQLEKKLLLIPGTDAAGHISPVAPDPGRTCHLSAAPGAGEGRQVGIVQRFAVVGVAPGTGCFGEDLGTVLLQIFLQLQMAADLGGVFGICLLRKGNKGENNCDYIKLISFFTVKETINQIKRKQLNRSTYIL